MDPERVGILVPARLAVRVQADGHHLVLGRHRPQQDVLDQVEALPATGRVAEEELVIAVDDRAHAPERVGLGREGRRAPQRDATGGDPVADLVRAAAGVELVARLATDRRVERAGGAGGGRRRGEQLCRLEDGSPRRVPDLDPELAAYRGGEEQRVEDVRAGQVPSRVVVEARQPAHALFEAGDVVGVPDAGRRLRPVVERLVALAADHGILAEEVDLVGDELLARLEGVALQCEHHEDVVRELLAEARHEVVEHPVAPILEARLVLGQACVEQVVPEPAPDRRRTRPRNPADAGDAVHVLREVGVRHVLAQGEERANAGQLAQVVGEHLVVERQVGLELPRLGHPCGAGGGRQARLADAVRPREVVLDGDVPRGVAIAAPREGQRLVGLDVGRLAIHGAQMIQGPPELRGSGPIGNLVLEEQDLGPIDRQHRLVQRRHGQTPLLAVPDGSARAVVGPEQHVADRHDAVQVHQGADDVGDVHDAPEPVASRSSRLTNPGFVNTGAPWQVNAGFTYGPS